jgi:sucrose phosphorylase
LLQARRASAAFHPHGEQQVLDYGEAIFALLRLSPNGDQRVLCLHNITNQPQLVLVNWKATFPLSSGSLIDLITQAEQPLAGNVVLKPYQTLWLRIKE